MRVFIPQPWEAHVAHVLMVTEHFRLSYGMTSTFPSSLDKTMVGKNVVIVAVIEE